MTETANKVVKIRVENLISALEVAIISRKKFEKDNGYGMPSALLSGWRHSLDEITIGSTVEILGRVMK